MASATATPSKTKTNVHTPVGILSYPALLSPRTMKGQTKATYSMLLVFTESETKSDLFKSLRAEATRAMKEKWPNKAPTGLKSPFRENAEKDVEPFVSRKGGLFVTFRSEQKPGLIDEQKNEILTTDEIWSGQLWRASVRAFAYDVSGNRGVSFALINAQRVKRDMPRIDGRISADKDFDEVDTAEYGGDDDDEDNPF